VHANEADKDVHANEADKDVHANEADKDVHANEGDKDVHKNEPNKDEADKDVRESERTKDVHMNEPAKDVRENEADKQARGHKHLEERQTVLKQVHHSKTQGNNETGSAVRGNDRQQHTLEVDHNQKPVRTCEGRADQSSSHGVHTHDRSSDDEHSKPRTSLSLSGLEVIKAGTPISARSNNSASRSGDAPTRSGDAPTRSGDAPTRSGDAPTRSGDASNSGPVDPKSWRNSTGTGKARSSENPHSHSNTEKSPHSTGALGRHGPKDSKPTVKARGVSDSRSSMGTGTTATTAAAAAPPPPPPPRNLGVYRRFRLSDLIVFEPGCADSSKVMKVIKSDDGFSIVYRVEDRQYERRQEGGDQDYTREKNSDGSCGNRDGGVRERMCDRQTRKKMKRNATHTGNGTCV
jgi:hypothetical protein